MAIQSDKEKRFAELIDDYKEIVAKVCYLYISAHASFDDLYQEVLINLWQGLDSFRGEAKISTWIYRTALNTCITWHRRNNKYSSGMITSRRIITKIITFFQNLSFVGSKPRGYSKPHTKRMRRNAAEFLLFSDILRRLP